LACRRGDESTGNDWLVRSSQQHNNGNDNGNGNDNDDNNQQVKSIERCCVRRDARSQWEERNYANPTKLEMKLGGTSRLYVKVMNPGVTWLCPVGLIVLNVPSMWLAG